MVTYNINLDITPGGIPKIVHVKQYQTDATLGFKLYSRHGTLTIGNVTDCSVRGTKSDGNGYSADARFVSNTTSVEVTLTDQMTAVAGRQPYEITVTDSTGKMITATFYLDVQRAALDGDTISASEIRELTNALDHSTEIINAYNQSLYDDTPTANSTHAVKSGGIKTYVDSTVTNGIDTYKQTVDATIDTVINEISEGNSPFIYKRIPNQYPDANGFPTYNNWDRTDYIPVTPGDVICFENTYLTNDNYWYDSGKSPMDQFRINVGLPTLITVPSGAAYMVVSNKSTSFFGQIYKKITAFATPEDVNSIKESLDETRIPFWVIGSYIPSNGATVDINDVVTFSSFAHAVIKCKPGDSFIITGTGGSVSSDSSGVLWCFINSSGTSLLKTTEQKEYDLKITAPSNAAYLVVNVSINYPYHVKHYTLVDQYNSALERAGFENSLHPDLLVCNDVEQGFEWATDGIKKPNNSYVCSRTLIPVDGPAIYISLLDRNIRIVQYDEDFNFLDYFSVRKQDGQSCYITHKNTRYVGLSCVGSGIEKLSLKKVSAPEVIQYPYNSYDYQFADNYYYDDTGAAQQSTSWACVSICDPDPGDKYYTNSKYQNNFICFDEDNHVISGGASYVEVPNNGRIYTLPTGIKYCWVNIQKSKTHGDCSVVYYKVTKPEKILAIGDSLTWLDGRSGYDNATLFLGWQKQLEVAGYRVDSYGFSGYPVATDVSGAENASIYTQVVTNEMDVSTYDIIIFFMGTNDNLYEVTVGDPIRTYYKNTFDTTIFNEAYAGVLRYVREQNDAAKIIVVTPAKSEAAIRNYNKAIGYVEAIRQLSDVYCCYVCDMFKNLNISPNVNGFAQFYYDNTHPNKKGMERVGKLILDAVEHC